ncbi:hypothetical protein Tco_0849622 [Tanacetum coccineum]
MTRPKTHLTHDPNRPEPTHLPPLLGEIHTVVGAGAISGVMGATNLLKSMVGKAFLKLQAKRMFWLLEAKAVVTSSMFQLRILRHKKELHKNCDSRCVTTTYLAFPGLNKANCYKCLGIWHVVGWSRANMSLFALWWGELPKLAAMPEQIWCLARARVDSGKDEMGCLTAWQAW